MPRSSLFTAAARIANVPRVLGALVVAGALALGSGTALACSCAWSGGFWSVARRTDLVVRAEIVAHRGRNHGGNPLYMVVEVAEALKGEAPGKKLLVRGDYGADCLMYVSGYPVGSEWVLALPEGGRERPSEHCEGCVGPEYLAGICGEHGVRVDGEEAVGVFEGTDPQAGPRRVPLAEIRRRLREGGGELSPSVSPRPPGAGAGPAIAPGPPALGAPPVLEPAPSLAAAGELPPPRELDPPAALPAADGLAAPRGLPASPTLPAPPALEHGPGSP